MGGLIPLLLKPAASGNRQSVIFPLASSSSSSATSTITTTATTTASTTNPSNRLSLQVRRPSPTRILSAAVARPTSTPAVATPAPTPVLAPVLEPEQRPESPSPSHSPAPSLSHSATPSEAETQVSSSRPSSPLRTPTPAAAANDDDDDDDNNMSYGSPRQLAARRLSHAAPPSLPVLPYTPTEWAKAVAEVKRQYLNRRYRPCSVRCSEILDNIKDPSIVEPTYLIYLHFYAASSLEMSARALQTSSPYRTRLLQQARDHYRSADNLIRAADESATHRLARPSSVAASATSSSSSSSGSMHSPAGSISSRAWTNSTELTSPAVSVYSLEDAVSAAAKNGRAMGSIKITSAMAGTMTPTTVASPTPVRKRVTFSLSEPVIRPDSPTLGFDDMLMFGRGSSPEPPPTSTPTQTHVEAPAPAPITVTSSLRARQFSFPEEDPEELEETADASFASADPDAFELDHRSVHRYCGILSSLRGELASHLAEVEAQLAAPPMRRLSSAPSSPSSPASAFGGGLGSGRFTPDGFGSGDEMRALELRTRIERLRQNGWRRQRFDPRRYEELRENALAELA